MSKWRQVALKFFPEQRRIIENNEFTWSVYALFFDLLPMTREAHKSGNSDFLNRVYQFAEWCWKQKDKPGDTYNAVCVAFYEHLVDKPETYATIPEWIKPEIFDDIHDIFEYRMPAEKYQELLAKYDEIHHINLK